MSTVKVISIASGKGGVGKTNVAVNLAYQQARAGRKVLLLDADLGLANVDILLNLKPRKNLSDVLEGKCALKDILITAPGGFTVIPAASGKKSMAEMAHAQHAGIVMALSELEGDFDLMIVDNAAGISDSVVTFSRASHHVAVVCSDEPTSMADAYALIKVLNREAGITHFQVLRNRVSSDAEAQNGFNRLAETASRFLNVHLTYAGYIPDDPCVTKAVTKQQCVSEAFPASPASKAFREFSQRTDTWPTPTHAAGHVEFFVDRMNG